MISVIFEYQLPVKKSATEMLEMFKEAEPMFKKIGGLQRKTFCYDENTGLGMSIYQWESAEASSMCYSPSFLSAFEKAFGTTPKIRAMPALFVIDNI